MQCLFCGKELALLKRLRGGGEFCSEAHRKEYQEQYEQLALARLMQAKPRSEAAPLDRPSAPVTPDLAALAAVESQYAENEYTETAYDEAPAPTPVAAPIPVAAISIPEPAPKKPAARKRAEPGDPAPLAGFLSEPLVPAVTPFEQAGSLDSETLTEHVTPSLPGFSIADSGGSARANGGSQETLPPAPRVALKLSLQALEHNTRVSERGVEVREFTGSAPVMELNLRPDTGSEPAGAADVMEIVMLPHPPQKAKPWLAAARVFPATPAELGDLGRLDFATTGFGQPEGFAYSDRPVAAPSASEPAVQAMPPAPTRVTEPEPEPEPELPKMAVPELVTRVLPVTLHGVAAPRAKLVQPFTSAITSAKDVQTPPSTALPLRPTIVFGPAPAPARTPEPAAAPVPAKPAPPAPAAAGPVKSERTAAPAATPSKGVPAKRAAAPAPPAPEKVQEKVQERPKPQPAALRAEAKTEAKPEARIEPKVEPRVEKKIEPRMETPAEPRFDSSLDSRKAWPIQSTLGTSAAQEAGPSLHLDSTQSAWSKLSSGVKIGVAAGAVVVISLVAYLVTRGGKPSEPAAAAPVTSSVVAGVPISGGWVDDWANASRSSRRISMLSGSVKLSDYRLEFQSQIETKAIGWVFRGLNPRNYYVAKLETIKPGLEPTVALVHFAVVDGQDDSRVVVPLPMKVRVDTNYKIRFDAVGSHFTTWVQDQKIAEWTDSRFGSGGVGFFSERDEKAALQGTVNVVALVPRN